MHNTAVSLQNHRIQFEEEGEEFCAATDPTYTTRSGHGVGSIGSCDMPTAQLYNIVGTAKETDTVH